MRRISIPLLLAGILTISLFAPASAITNGEPDGNAHPQVGQLLFYVPDFPDPRFDDPGAWFNCSGTLLSPTVLLTAGHCTFGVGQDGVSTPWPGGTVLEGNDIWVSFSEHPDYTILPPSTNYVPDGNQERYEDWRDALNGSSDWIRGSAYPHPEYVDAAFFLFDAGIVVLDQPVGGIAYGALPTLGHLDQYKKQKGQSQFTAVGYGLEFIRPIGAVGGDSRNNADQMLVNLTGVFGLGEGIAAVFSNNNGMAHQGGTCYGDSGGPIFEGDSLTIVAVTSFGVTPWCTGNGGGYRIDQADDLAWIGTFLP